MFEQGLRQMPDGTHGRCQGCLSKVMTRMRLLVGGLAFRTEAAALNDHRLAMVLQSIDHGSGQRVVNVEDPAPVAERTICGDVICAVVSRCSGLRFANLRPQSPLFLSSGGLPAANLLQTLLVLTTALVTGTRRVNGLATLPRTNTLPKSGFSTPVR